MKLKSKEVIELTRATGEKEYMAQVVIEEGRTLWGFIALDKTYGVSKKESGDYYLEDLSDLGFQAFLYCCCRFDREHEAKNALEEAIGKRESEGNRRIVEIKTISIS